MNPNLPNDPGSPGSPAPRPPKTGEPWPKRFTFTPDGSMSFIKHGDDGRRGRGPRRFDGPNRGPGGQGGPSRPGRPGGSSDRPGYGQRPDSAPYAREGPRPWGPPRPGSPQSAGSGPNNYGRPFRPAGPVPAGGRNAGPWRPPGAPPPPPPRPGFRTPPPDGARDRPRPEWKVGSPVRTIRNDPRPANPSNYRSPESRPRAPHDDRPQLRRSEGGHPYAQRPPDQRGFSQRPSRPPFDSDRNSGITRPWAGDSGQGLPARRLPRPQAGPDAPPSFQSPRSEELPAGREQLAARIIARASSNIPADLLLRQTLVRRKLLSRADGAWISRAVFACFRWQGWLDSGAMAEDRIARALSLADDFAISSAQMPDDELLAKAIPAWTREAMPVTPSWVRSLQAEPVLWLRTRRGMASEVTSKLANCEATPSAAFPDALRYDGHEDLFRHELFQAGAFEIQDIASQAVGVVCAPQPGETWWDACAGEGGKTLHLSSLMDGKGLVWSSDRAEWRLTRLKQRAGRAGCFNYRNVVWNGGPKPPTKTVFDGVLVDAPCAGLGTWGRNPHARWTTTPDDVRELAVVQLDLLSHAAPSVKPGGRLIYSVCTLSLAETTGVVDAFSAAHPEFEPVPLSNPFHPEAGTSPSLCLWPQDTGGNGMFIAAWRRLPGEAEGDAPLQDAAPSSQPGIGSPSEASGGNPS